jgi:hypothetical protein
MPLQQYKKNLFITELLKKYNSNLRFYNGNF